MKSCIYCGQANVDEVLTCPGCGGDLSHAQLDRVDPQLVDPELAPRVVASFRNAMEAGVLKARLEAAGIEAFVPEEYTAQLLWNVIPNPAQPVTVRVAAKDYEAARALAEESLQPAGASAAVPCEDWSFGRRH